MVTDMKNVLGVGVMATILLAINVLRAGAQVVKNAFPALGVDIMTVQCAGGVAMMTAQCAGGVAMMIVLIVVVKVLLNVMNAMVMVD